MKQRVRGLVLGLVCASAVSCGGSGDGDTGSSENPGSASAGMSSPSTAAAGSTGKAGSTGSSVSAGGGTSGTATSPATGTAGSKAAAGTSAAAGGGQAGSTTATAGSGSAGSSAAGNSGSASAAGGCGSESFAAIYDSIFKNTTYNCTGALCHGRESSMAMTVGNLSLSSASVAYMELVKVDSTSSACMGKMRVIPGDPMNSLLVQKLRGANVMCGGAMPIGGEEITDAELKRITDWISAGACNN